MIGIEKLNKTYGRGGQKNRVLRDVSLTLPDTGFVCILGPSGCGKTTLLNAVGGLDVYDSGSITVGKRKFGRMSRGRFEAERNRSFGYIFQNYYLLAEHSVGYNVYLGLHSLKLSHSEKLRRVREALAAVEMERFIRRNVSELSGGQQQRVAIARALARKPRVIFADEPTGNLDEANTMNICSLLRRISRTSLVIMVTHEERIARFFADRIITLENGTVTDDSESWQRGDLHDSRTLYTGDYAETRLEDDGIRIRCFREEGAPEVELAILALKDRIIIKLDDGRTVTCGTSQEQPTVVEGQRPVLTLEELEQKESDTWDRTDEPAARAGRGIRLRDLFAEARHLSHAGSRRRFGVRLFLVVLSVLTALSAADLMTLASVDPRDFVQTHSQVLEVQLERGAAGAVKLGMQELSDEFKSYLDECGQEYRYTPLISSIGSVSGSPFPQTSQLEVKLTWFSYVPMELLSQDSLILGRMPESWDEVVVDRWVLDEILEKDGVAQNGITGIDYFLGKVIRYEYFPWESPVIVGICDSGEPAMYISDEVFAGLGVGGAMVARLSTLRQEVPGVYDSLELAEGECIILPENAGSKYRDKLYATYRLNTNMSFRIAHSIEETAIPAKIVVTDEDFGKLLLSMSPKRFFIYCEDKEAMTAYLESIPEKMNNAVIVTVVDSYAEKMAEYSAASQLRVDARTIVTATVVALSMAMLYLLRRSQVYERIGMLSVYRLLGIPPRKAVGIFAIESLLDTLTTALPATAAVWAVLAVLRRFPDLGIELLMPVWVAAAVYGGIVCFHLLVSTVPLRRLLRLPPAQLAAKFDF